jgi:ABC-type uncharacterized transport system permease subunit
MTVLFFIAVGFYALSAVVYFIHLLEISREDDILKVARWTLLAGIVTHLAMIGWLCTLKLNPLRDLRGALSLSGFLIATIYWLISYHRGLVAVGASIVPLTLSLLISARITPQNTPASGSEATAGILGELHLALSALGVATLGLAAAVALIYLFQESALKRKRMGALLRRAKAPLSILDGVGHKLIAAGFLFFTLAIVTGIIWMHYLPGHHKVRPEYWISGITWTTFALLILGRLTVGWRGRLGAWLTLIGFLATLAVLGIYISRRMLAG